MGERLAARAARLLRILADIVAEDQRAADGELAVEIADHGGGFTTPPEECFQPFRTTKPGGLGVPAASGD